MIARQAARYRSDAATRVGVQEAHRSVDRDEGRMKGERTVAERTAL